MGQPGTATPSPLQQVPGERHAVMLLHLLTAPEILLSADRLWDWWMLVVLLVRHLELLGC